MKPTNYILPLFLLMLMFASGCVGLDDKQSIRGDRNIVSNLRTVDPFHHLTSSGNLVLLLRHSSSPGVTVTVDQNLQDYIYTEVVDGVLNIGMPDNCRINASKTLLVEVNYVDLSNIEIAGSVKLRCDNTLIFDSLKVTCAGASNFDWTMEGSFLDVHIPGASIMKLAGKVRCVQMQLDGASSVDASSLNTGFFSLTMAGASKVNLWVTRQLNVDLAGAGYVSYKGNPAVKNVSVNGFGKVTPDESN